ncbi:MAG: hypothetical protein NVS1B5_04170 [Gemmatimonadaceae bacterium]
MRGSVVLTVAIAGALAQHPHRLGGQRAQAAVGSASIVGAWRIVSRTYTSRDSTYTDRQRDAGYYLFVAGHYSFVAPAGEALRPHDQGTDARRVALYNTFGAQAGTYTLQGDTLTLRAYAAKNPGNVGMSVRWRVTIRGDTLTMESERAYKRNTSERARYVLLRADAEMTAAAPTRDGVEREIVVLERRKAELLTHRDRSLSDSTLADDYLSINSAGLVGDKANAVRLYTTGLRQTSLH